MDATITYDEVAALVGVNIPTLEPRLNFERIRALRRHLERCLQCLPCPQSVQHGWKGMVMARPLYNLLTNIAFRLPTNPGAPVNNTPLTRTEQVSFDTAFNRCKHYFLSMQNIERACFTALDSSINDAFKVSNDPSVQGWHAGMRVIDILDQLSLIYGQPTPMSLEAMNTSSEDRRQPPTPPKSSSAASKNAPRLPANAPLSKVACYLDSNSLTTCYVTTTKIS